MKSLPVILAIWIFSFGLYACGGSSGDSNTAAQAKTADGYVRGDRDLPGDDNRSYNGREYGDDYLVHGYGHQADEADARGVSSVVKRYYAAAAAGSGALACSLIYSKLADLLNFASAVPSEYEAAPGSSIYRDKTCAEVESLLFKLEHQQLAAEVPTLQVTNVRVEGNHGLVLLGFKTNEERTILVQREHGAWKIDSLLDSELP